MGPKRKAAGQARRLSFGGAARRECRGSNGHMNLNLAPTVNLLEDAWFTFNLSVTAQLTVGPGTQDVTNATGATTLKL